MEFSSQFYTFSLLDRIYWIRLSCIVYKNKLVLLYLPRSNFPSELVSCDYSNSYLVIYNLSSSLLHIQKYLEIIIEYDYIDILICSTGTQFTIKPNGYTTRTISTESLQELSNLIGASTTEDSLSRRIDRILSCL